MARKSDSARAEPRPAHGSAPRGPEVAALPPEDADLLALARPEGLEPGQPGLFAEDSWLRRVSGESVVLFGGGRALLLEVAHPLVAAGVAEHSNFRTDPLGRLQRTLNAMQAIAFGSVADALRAARSVEAAHRRVRGTLRQAAGVHAAGAPYSGRAPDLVRWVWATLADTALVVFERFAEPLDDAAREAYYADHSVMARLLGVPPELVPADWAAFRAWFDGMLDGDELAVTGVGREIAGAVLRPPVELGGTRLVRAVTAGLMPPRLRREFGLRWDDARAARFEELTRTVRGLRSSPSGSATRPAGGPAAGPARLDGGSRRR